MFIFKTTGININLSEQNLINYWLRRRYNDIKKLPSLLVCIAVGFYWYAWPLSFVTFFFFILFWFPVFPSHRSPKHYSRLDKSDFYRDYKTFNLFFYEQTYFPDNTINFTVGFAPCPFERRVLGRGIPRQIRPIPVERKNKRFGWIHKMNANTESLKFIRKITPSQEFYICTVVHINSEYNL